MLSIYIVTLKIIVGIVIYIRYIEILQLVNKYHTNNIANTDDVLETFAGSAKKLIEI